MADTWDLADENDYTIIVKGGSGNTYRLGNVDPYISGIKDRTLIPAALRMWADIIERQEP